MFSKKKKKIEISAPSNFQHRVHTGFDNHSNKFVGLPKQWASLVDDKPASNSPFRPSPMVDPSTFTPTDALEAKNGGRLLNGSAVVRSNSLRSTSPPNVRRQMRPPNLPPVPEMADERFSQMQIHPGNSPNHHQQYPPRPVVPPGMMSNRSSVSSSDQFPPPLQRPYHNGQHHPQRMVHNGPPQQAYRYENCHCLKTIDSQQLYFFPEFLILGHLVISDLQADLSAQYLMTRPLCPEGPM